jgi:uncharacterized membrane protein
VRNADLPHSGAVTLTDVKNGITRVIFTLEYAPPPGIQDEVAWEHELLPFLEHCIRTTLNQFKSMVETRGRVGANPRQSETS